MKKMDKRRAYKIVLDDLKKVSLFCGKYDASHGKEDYMYGISTVMEFIANHAGYHRFEYMFLRNMVKSEERVKEK